MIFSFVNLWCPRLDVFRATCHHYNKVYGRALENFVKLIYRIRRNSFYADHLLKIRERILVTYHFPTKQVAKIVLSPYSTYERKVVDTIRTSFAQKSRSYSKASDSFCVLKIFLFHFAFIIQNIFHCCFSRRC